jgi:outer membrane protein assembly factor BamB
MKRKRPSHKRLFPVLGLLALLLTGMFYAGFRLRSIDPTPEGNFPDQPVWIFEADSKIAATPVIQDSQVFVRTLKSIYSINLSDGTIIWRRNSIADSGQSLTPQIHGNYLVVVEKGEKIATLSTDTGRVLWRSHGYEWPTMMDAVVIGDDFVTVGRLNWTVTTYDLETGKILWEQDVPGRTSLSLFVDNDLLYLGYRYTLRVYQGRVGSLLNEKTFDEWISFIYSDYSKLFVSFSEGEINLRGFDPLIVTETWKIPYTELNSGRITSLVADRDFLYGAGNMVLAVNKEKGTVVWINDPGESFEIPLLLGDDVYSRNIGNSVYRFDKRTGIIVGRLIVKANSAIIGDPDVGPAGVGDLLIVPYGDNRLFAYLVDRK